MIMGERPRPVKLLLTAAATAVTLAVVIQAGGASADQQIVGGTVASTADHEYVVYVANRSGFQFCGGTLVARNKVVTAAHCTTGKEPADMRVVAGRDDKESRDGTVAKVTKIWRHPDFKGVQSGADVAVLTLGTRLGYRPADLPRDETLYQAGTPSTILGWGRTREGGDTSRYLLAATVPVVSDADCARSYQHFSAESMVCAGYPEGGVDACQGDSGGPMVVGTTLVGIASWGDGCARANKPGVYTRVSRYVGLISAQLQQEGRTG
jgi:trypsin